MKGEQINSTYKHPPFLDCDPWLIGAMTVLIDDAEDMLRNLMQDNSVAGAALT